MLTKLKTESDRVLLPVNGLIKLLTEVFEAAGGETEEALTISSHLVEATLSGHDSHGIIRVPRYLEAVASGNVFFGRVPEAVIDNGHFAVFDGGHGFGQWLAKATTEQGIERARQHGVALVALRKAGHVGRIGAWAEQACAAGIVSIHFVNVVAAPLVAPFGGAGRRMSTNPVSIGVPNAQGDDFLLDFATSRVAEGKILVAQKAGKTVDSQNLVDGNGNPSGDPLSLYGSVAPGEVPDPRKGPGALMPMGEHKGSGLSLACELLAGALTGSGTSSPGTRVHNGMFSIFVDPDVLDDGHGWAESVISYIDEVRACPPRDAENPVLIPGDPERKARRERTENGVPLDRQSWDDILSGAERFGLSSEHLLEHV